MLLKQSSSLFENLCKLTVLLDQQTSSLCSNKTSSSSSFFFHLTSFFIPESVSLHIFPLNQICLAVNLELPETDGHGKLAV